MKMLKITLQGKTYEVGVEVIDAAATATSVAAPLAAPAVAVSAPIATPIAPVAPAPVAATPTPAAPTGGQSVSSPMPGLVFKISVAVGQQVAKDQELVVLEAMKMESPIYAPNAGTVAAILVKQGDAVAEGQPLVQLS